MTRVIVLGDIPGRMACVNQNWRRIDREKGIR